MKKFGITISLAFIGIVIAIDYLLFPIDYCSAFSATE